MQRNPVSAAGRQLDLEAVRRRLETTAGPEFWRSLEELADAPEFLELLEREFPRQASELPTGVDRRRFLQLAAASLALGGLTACTRQPPERIVPYVEQPESLIPGRPIYFASSMPFDGFARPVLVESHMGRPTKIEGHPDHPASQGSADLFTQASILEMYDPERSKVVRNLGRIRTWEAFGGEMRTTLDALTARGEARIRILTSTVTSPSLAGMIDRLLVRHPAAQWHQYTPVTRDAQRQASRELFGRFAAPRYRLEDADVIVSLDADFLISGPDSIANARAFAQRRRAGSDAADLSRLYMLESTPTATGTLADHRLPATSQEIARVASHLADQLAVPGAEGSGQLSPIQQSWVEALAGDLRAHPGRCLVIPGDCSDAKVHTLAHAINVTLGNVGHTVDYTDPVEAQPELEIDSLRALTTAMRQGEVDILLILGSNPVYDAPTDLDFTIAMEAVDTRIHLGTYEDETAEYCQWHLPEAHYLESWGDGRAFDGSVCFTQPLIEPLYDGKTATEVLSLFADDRPRRALELLESYWREQLPGPDFPQRWRRWLHDGFIGGSELGPVEVSASAESVTAACAEIDQPNPPAGSIELILRPDPTLHDGHWANNGWLQECPKPLTKLTWDNALLLAPATAEVLGIANTQLVEISVGEKSVSAPAWLLPGHPAGTATLHLGYGRRTTGKVGSGTGFDAYPLRTTDRMWATPGVTLRPGAGTYPLVSTQLHSNIELEGEEAETRHLIRVGTVREFEEEPHFAQHVGHSADTRASLYPGWEYKGNAWGMTIDLSSCTGCNACVVACQSENNIAIVGKEQVARGREMHWIRIDRYYQGGLDAPDVHHQPVLCMQCEQAPCEPVCPVGATVHSEEGLNDMVYNRCVGTRYCSNNCPYKVRRFNFFKFTDTDSPILEMLRNPDVTVRSRGVMEKCTYCVQRINYARIESEKENRPIRDGEIQTACQQTCPTQAIVFGNINDPDSAVAKSKQSPLNYGILEELGTRPRTSYLAKLRNPNPNLETV